MKKKSSLAGLLIPVFAIMALFIWSCEKDLDTETTSEYGDYDLAKLKFMIEGKEAIGGETYKDSLITIRVENNVYNPDSFIWKPSKDSVKIKDSIKILGQEIKDYKFTSSGKYIFNVTISNTRTKVHGSIMFYVKLPNDTTDTTVIIPGADSTEIVLLSTSDLGNGLIRYNLGFPKLYLTKATTKYYFAGDFNGWQLQSTTLSSNGKLVLVTVDTKNTDGINSPKQYYFMNIKGGDAGGTDWGWIQSKGYYRKDGANEGACIKFRNYQIMRYDTVVATIIPPGDGYFSGDSASWRYQQTSEANIIWLNLNKAKNDQLTSPGIQTNTFTNNAWASRNITAFYPGTNWIKVVLTNADYTNSSHDFVVLKYYGNLNNYPDPNKIYEKNYIKVNESDYDKKSYFKFSIQNLK